MSCYTSRRLVSSVAVVRRAGPCCPRQRGAYGLRLLNYSGGCSTPREFVQLQIMILLFFTHLLHVKESSRRSPMPCMLYVGLAPNPNTFHLPFAARPITISWLPEGSCVLHSPTRPRPSLQNSLDSRKPRLLIILINECINQDRGLCGEHALSS